MEYDVLNSKFNPCMLIYDMQVFFKLYFEFTQVHITDLNRNIDESKQQVLDYFGASTTLFDPYYFHQEV